MKKNAIITETFLCDNTIKVGDPVGVGKGEIYIIKKHSMKGRLGIVSKVKRIINSTGAVDYICEVEYR